MEVQRLQRVNEVSASLVRTPGGLGDLNRTLRHIAQTAQNAFAPDACVILAFNPITTKFIGSHIVVGDLQAKNELLHDKPRPNGATEQVLKEGIFLVEDLEVTPQYHNRFTRGESIRSFAGLAMRSRHRQRPLGVIYLDFRQPREFSPTDYENYRIFATQAAFLLQETWLESHLEEVARIGQEINHNLATVEGLFQELQTYVDNVLDESHTLLLGIYQSQTNTLDLHIREQEQISFMNMPLQGAYKDVIETQESWFIRELTTEAERIQLQVIDITIGTEKKESLIFVPLTLRDVPLGVLSVQHPLPKAYGQEDLFVLQLLANYIALALHNMRLYSSLTQLNETGQVLTQQLDSKQVLQATVDKIRDATQADIVVLYPHEPSLQRFMLPPRIAGTLQDQTFPQPKHPRPDDIAVLTLHHEEPIFAQESTTLYMTLHGDIRIQQGDFQHREKVRSTAAIPLRVGDESVGVLFVNFRQPQRFHALQRLFIEGLAHYAAIAIKNAQAFATLSQRRLRELEILQKIDRELNRTLDLETVLNTLLKLAKEQLAAEKAAITLYNPRTQVLESAVTLGHYAEAQRKLNIPLNEIKGITCWVLENKKPARVDNVYRDPQWQELCIPASPDTVSELDVPLLDGDEVIGVLNFESAREGAFRQEDEDFLLTLAGQAVLAIKNAQAYEREKRLAEEGQVLNQISKEITSQLDPVHVFDLILEKALELTHSTTGNLMLYDPDQDDLWMAAERGVAKDKKGKRQSLEEGIVGFVARNKQLLNVDLSQPPWNDVNLDFILGTRSELAVPLLAGNDLRGVLNIESFSPNNFTKRDERLLTALADLAVVALQNAQAYESEKRLAEEAQVLNEISKEITSQLDHAHAFDLILEKALELTHSNLGNLMLYDPDLNDLWMGAERGVAEDKKGHRQRFDQGIVGLVATNKQLLNVDPSQTPWNEIYLEFFPGARSELAVPMLEGNEIRGVLNIESPYPNNFNERDVRLLKGLADLAVVALQNAERYKKAEREAQRFKLLYRAGQELSKITDLAQIEQAYDVILHIAEQHSKGQVIIRRYEANTQELAVIRTSESQDLPLLRLKNLDVDINEQVTRERRTIVIYNTNNLPSSLASAQLSDSITCSLLITPIMFKDQYYGNLGLRHKDVGYFRGTDVIFFEGLAQQLAITIYRLETAHERQEFKQRAITAEVMSSIGHMAFELIHRWDNDLGLVRSYVNDILSELKKLDITNIFISEKLGNIVQAARTILDLSKELKQVLVRSGEALAGEITILPSRSVSGKPAIISPRILLEEAKDVPSLPSTIQIEVEIDEDVAAVRVIHSSVADILHNLVANAIEAMPAGGKITLEAHNVGRFVALEVTDTGIGIPRQSLSQIFNLFYSTKGSSGFGLWSARTNALRNHGDLMVKSQQGLGTTFTLLLPRAEGEYHEALSQ